MAGTSTPSPTGSFRPDGRIDPDRALIISCFGRKGSGKSVMALLIFRSYPRDKVVIDIAGDDGPIGEDVIELTGNAETLPASWPEWRRVEDKPMTLRYVPDPGSPTELADIDAVVGLAMAHGDCMLLVHEIGRAAPVHQVQPNMSRLLMHNRHRNVTAAFCGPRPQGIDTLVLGQSDLVYIFDVTARRDRQRIAETIDWDVNDLVAEVAALRQYEYLRYDRNIPKPEPDEPDLRLVSFPPLPAQIVRPVVAYAHGTGRPQVAVHG